MAQKNPYREGANYGKLFKAASVFHPVDENGRPKGVFARIAKNTGRTVKHVR